MAACSPWQTSSTSLAASSPSSSTRAEVRGSVAAVAWGCAGRAETEIRAGRLRAAEADAEEALTVALQYDVGVVVPSALAYLAEVHL